MAATTQCSPSLRLNNGVEMPQIGLGTFLIPKENLCETIGEAYRLGYRQFDTAWRYHNEQEIAEALRLNGIKREEVFITTKINADALYRFNYWYGKHRFMNVRNFKSIRRAILESFDNLHTDYIDLFLVHWPWPMYLKMYKDLARLYYEGRIRAIGVSSFTEGHLKSLQEVSDVIPAVNQFEISPLNTQKTLIGFCRSMGVQPQAMSTFSHFRSNEPRKEILEHPVLLDIAQKKGKTVAQIVLRWLVQQNIAIIPKTWNFTHLKENISLFDFYLTPEEMTHIDSLDQGKCLNYNPYAPHIIKSIPKAYRKYLSDTGEL